MALQFSTELEIPGSAVRHEEDAEICGLEGKIYNYQYAQLCM